MDVLVLGARGGVGRLTCDELARRGHTIRTLADRRDAYDAGAIARIGAGAIVNCAGASVAFGLGRGWRGYRAVDTPIGLAAVEAARRTNARLVYVGVHHAPALARCWYVEAHERVARAMRDIDGVVVRATGFYSAFAALVPLARRGLLADIGDGRARTNPIAEQDLAAILAEVVTGDGPRELSAGGPEVMTRRDLFLRVLAAAGHPSTAKVRAIPAWLAGAGAAMLCALHPRIGQFMRFATWLARHDNIAPAVGTLRLADYLGSRTAGVIDRRVGA
jgi:uncharacterized protein YbjT (DUF2867 family)